MMPTHRGHHVVAALALIALPATASADDPKDLCRAGERPVFRCEIARSRKLVSICATQPLTATEGYLQYRFGRPDAIELEHPASRERSQEQFRYRRVSVGRNDSGEWRVGFERSGAVYEVFYDGTIDREHAGVLAYRRARDGKLTRTAKLDCATDEGAQDLRELASVLPHDKRSLD